MHLEGLAYRNVVVDGGIIVGIFFVLPVNDLHSQFCAEADAAPAKIRAATAIVGAATIFLWPSV